MEITELEALKLIATQKGIPFSTNIGYETLKKRIEDSNGGEEKTFNFEEVMLESFNTAIKKEKDCYNEIFDIKRGVFKFHFTARNQEFVDRFTKSLVHWIKEYDLSIDELRKTDVAFSTNLNDSSKGSIKIFPNRSPKILSKRQKEELKKQELKEQGF